MTISSPEREAKKVKIAVDRNPVETSFEKWACDLKKGEKFDFTKNENVNNFIFFFMKNKYNIELDALSVSCEKKSISISNQKVNFFIFRIFETKLIDS